MDKQLQGRVALVIGGSTGIGFGAARRLLAEGATVYVTSRRRDELERANGRLGNLARVIPADVTSKADMRRVAEAIRQESGRLDILFANASGGRPTPLADVTEDQIDKELAVNVKGVVLTMQAVLPLLGEGSCVILNASITADMGLPGFAVYAATKAAVRSLARSWTGELGDRRIRVNSLSPSVVPTEGYGTEMGMSDADIAAYVERVGREIPVGRAGTVEDIADALVFLASDASRFITGVDLVVDGGMTRVFAGKN